MNSLSPFKVAKLVIFAFRCGMEAGGKGMESRCRTSASVWSSCATDGQRQRRRIAARKAVRPIARLRQDFNPLGAQKKAQPKLRQCELQAVLLVSSVAGRGLGFLNSRRTALRDYIRAFMQQIERLSRGNVRRNGLEVIHRLGRPDG